MHVRTSIVERIELRMKTIPGVATGKSRFGRHEKLPAIAVYADDEIVESDDESVDPDFRIYNRFVDVNIEFTAAADAQFEETADDHSVLIEQQLAIDDDLNGLSAEVLLVSSSVNYDPREAEPAASMILKYRVWYRTTAQDPQTPIA